MSHHACRVLFPGGPAAAPAPAFAPEAATFESLPTAAFESLPRHLSFPVDAPRGHLRMVHVNSDNLTLLIEHVDLPAAVGGSNLLMEALTHQLTSCTVDVLPGQVSVLRHRLAVHLALHRHRYLDSIVEAVTRNYGYYDGSTHLDHNRIPNMQAMVDGYIRDTGDPWTVRAFGMEVFRACADSEAVNILLLVPGQGTLMVSPHQGVTPLRTVCLMCSNSGGAPRYSSVFKVDFHTNNASTLPAAPTLCALPRSSYDSGLESSPPPRRNASFGVPIKREAEENESGFGSDDSDGARMSCSDTDAMNKYAKNVGHNGASEKCSSATPARGVKFTRIAMKDRPLVLATWNVGCLSTTGNAAPLSPWLGTRLDGPSGAARALAANGVHIAALQGDVLESCTGELEGYTVFAHRRDVPGPGTAAVSSSSGSEAGFAVRDDLLGAVSRFVSSPSARACRLDLFGSPANVSLVSALAPPEDADVREHERFSRALHNLVSSAPVGAVLVVLGDFGAEIGRKLDALRSVAGKSSLHADFNSNGVRLLHFATRNNLVISSTALDKKQDARATRMTVQQRADGSQRLSCTQVDHVLVRRRHRDSVVSIRSVPNAGLSDANHRMLLTVVSAPVVSQDKGKKVSTVLEEMMEWKEAHNVAEELYLRLTTTGVGVDRPRAGPSEAPWPKQEESLKQEPHETTEEEDINDVMHDLSKLLQEIKECETMIESRPTAPRGRPRPCLRPPTSPVPVPVRPAPSLSISPISSPVPSPISSPVPSPIPNPSLSPITRPNRSRHSPIRRQLNPTFTVRIPGPDADPRSRLGPPKAYRTLGPPRVLRPPSSPEYKFTVRIPSPDTSRARALLPRRHDRADRAHPYLDAPKDRCRRRMLRDAEATSSRSSSGSARATPPRCSVFSGGRVGPYVGRTRTHSSRSRR